MKVIIFKGEEFVSLLVPLVADSNLWGIPIGVPYFEKDVTELPSEPQEAWELSDEGVITVDQQKLKLFNRMQLPDLSPEQFDLIFSESQYDELQAFIQIERLLKITYTRSRSFNRISNFVEQVRIALNITEDQLDVIWSEALKNKEK